MEYILAHGSRNTFVMVDAVAQRISEVEYSAEYVAGVCDSYKSDGMLFVEFDTAEGLYVMNMYNTDGTRAEMCGNGMRIVARYVDERYVKSESFTLLSGGRKYNITRHAPNSVTLADGTRELIPNYGVDIAIRTNSEEFTLAEDNFVAQPIAELDSELEFTYLNLGNPHIVARVEEIDLEHLSRLGERVKQLPHIFTRGVNVSFLRSINEHEIFVATYERGVGLTPSCGTAMTASSTAAALMGIVPWGEKIMVRNLGGFVRCICSRNDTGLSTQLIGNATYIEQGVIEGEVTQRFTRETEAWDILTK